MRQANPTTMRSQEIISELRRKLLSANSLGVICALILCGILVAGLWPFHRPQNEVSWLGDDDGLRFGKYATVLSSGTLRMRSSGDEASCSLEIWLRPSFIGPSSTFLAFSTPENPLQFSLRQSGPDLELQRDSRSQPYQARTAKLEVGHVFREAKRVFLTVTSGPQGTLIYVDGTLVRTSREFRLAGNDCTGQLVVGDSPLESDNWSGQLRGLAIYNRQLTGEQVFRHYETWAAMGRPEVSEDERSVALYLFDEDGGRVVHNHAGSGIDLYIPERYLILHQVLLKPPWKEFEPSLGYLKDVLINIAGFIPFGFFFCAYFSAAGRLKRAALATIILGATLSLAIEILQAYLPTRYSGMTDIVTNTFGTWIGALAYWARAPAHARGARWPRGEPAAQGRTEVL
jgi:VanZ family protein